MRWIYIVIEYLSTISYHIDLSISNDTYIKVQFQETACNQLNLRNIVFSLVTTLVHPFSYWSYIGFISLSVSFSAISKFLLIRHSNTSIPVMAVTDAICSISPHELVNSFKLCFGILPTLIQIPMDGRHMYSYKSAWEIAFRICS
jgi:hypothetical protein